MTGEQIRTGKRQGRIGERLQRHRRSPGAASSADGDDILIPGPRRPQSRTIKPSTTENSDIREGPNLCSRTPTSSSC